MHALITFAVSAVIVVGVMVTLFRYGLRDLRESPDTPDNDR